eukprot:scaffold21070_cov107-Isochrysis_galbana.AAC.5
MACFVFNVAFPAVPMLIFSRQGGSFWRSGSGYGGPRELVSRIVAIGLLCGKAASDERLARGLSAAEQQ